MYSLLFHFFTVGRRNKLLWRVLYWCILYWILWLCLHHNWLGVHHWRLYILHCRCSNNLKKWVKKNLYCWAFHSKFSFRKFGMKWSTIQILLTVVIGIWLFLAGAELLHRLMSNPTVSPKITIPIGTKITIYKTPTKDQKDLVFYLH